MNKTLTKTAKRDGLLDLFMNRVRVAMGTKLFQLKTSCGIPTIFHRRVTRYPSRSLIRIRATLCAL